MKRPKNLRFLAASIFAVPHLLVFPCYLTLVIAETVHYSLPTIINQPISIVVLAAYYTLPTLFGIIDLLVFSAIVWAALSQRDKPRYQLYLLWLYILIILTFAGYDMWWHLTSQVYDAI